MHLIIGNIIIIIIIITRVLSEDYVCTLTTSFIVSVHALSYLHNDHHMQ